MGSSTPLHDTQLPDSDTMSSVAAAVAAVQAAAHHHTTRNCPTVAGWGWAAAPCSTTPPDGNMTGSVQVAAVAAMWTAPQRGMTRNRPTATQQAACRRWWW